MGGKGTGRPMGAKRSKYLMGDSNSWWRLRLMPRGGAAAQDLPTSRIIIAIG